VHPQEKRAGLNHAARTQPPHGRPLHKASQCAQASAPHLNALFLAPAAQHPCRGGATLSSRSCTFSKTPCSAYTTHLLHNCQRCIPEVGHPQEERAGLNHTATTQPPHGRPLHTLSAISCTCCSTPLLRRLHNLAIATHLK
jgi:hypothetical protein